MFVKRILIIPFRKLSYEAEFSHNVEVMTSSKLNSFKSNIRSFCKEFKNYIVCDIDEYTIETWLKTHKLDISSILDGYTENPTNACNC